MQPALPHAGAAVLVALLPMAVLTTRLAHRRLRNGGAGAIRVGIAMAASSTLLAAGAALSML